MARPQNGLRRGPALALALLVCALISVWHGSGVGGRAARPVSGFVRDAAIVPAASLSGDIGRWWRTNILSCLDGRRLARSNARLRARVDRLTLENRLLAQDAAENGRLRAMLGLEQKSALPLLAADIASIKPFAQSDTLIISRGLRDGVGPHSVVLAPDGALVGQVIEASAHSSSVLLLTDSISSVGAQIARPGPISTLAPDSPASGLVGICEGDRSSLLDLDYLSPEADVRSGDPVTTSGLGGVYPRDVPIGRVVSVKDDTARSLKEAEVMPLVDFDHLEQVLVLPAEQQ